MGVAPVGSRTQVMNLKESFDAVLMLTWSDWKSEPRSNRYHFATRFSRLLPVLFFQHNNQQTVDFSVENTNFKNIDIVNLGCESSSQDVGLIRRLLAARGIKRPLVWIYDPVHYDRLIDSLPQAFRVFHATEDYFAETTNWSSGIEHVRERIVQRLKDVNLLVACSHEVARSYRASGGFGGPLFVSENGCDAEYLLGQAGLHRLGTGGPKKPSAMFQGGINQRLDYDLLLELVRTMPDWEFKFCGLATESTAWARILQLANVQYLGMLDAEGVAREMCGSTVGLIPFIQDQWIRNSLPLKAFEYVACGLPVVSVPITSLEGQTDLISFATSAAEFEHVIRSVANTRYDPALLARRREAALAKSYEKRFVEVCEALVTARRDLVGQHRRLRVAMLYDGVGSMHVSTIREHLESFHRYSVHDYTFIPATPSYWLQSPEEVESSVEFSAFDVVLVHYSIRLSIREHFEEGLVRALERFQGLKGLFIQDEYEGTEIARAWMDRVNFDLVYTCVPSEGLERIYPGYRFPATEFLPTLTGYVPEDVSIERFVQPLGDRKVLIAYRGRKLPAVYGNLGFEKYRIGAQMRIHAQMRGLPVDIEVDDSKRIYGSGWYELLGSARATLGTESGSNVFDFDGSLGTQIKALQARNPNMGFGEIFAQVLAPHEGLVAMNQVSPKIFEAIRLRTALVLFEGTYSGVVQPDVHFIPLKKDFSNIDEVLRKLQDDDHLRALTHRAYEDVVASGKYSYKRFVEGIDSDLERRVLHPSSPAVLLRSLHFIDSGGELRQALPLLPLGLTSGVHPLGRPVSPSRPADSMSPRAAPDASQPVGASVPPKARLGQLANRLKAALGTAIHVPRRARLGQLANALLRRAENGRERNSLVFRVARRAWHQIPGDAQDRILRLTGRR